MTDFIDAGDGSQREADRLTGPRAEVARGLYDLSPELGEMYVAALRIIADPYIDAKPYLVCPAPKSGTSC